MCSYIWKHLKKRAAGERFFWAYFENCWQTMFNKLRSCFNGRHYIQQNKRLLWLKVKSWHNWPKSWHFWEFDFILTLGAKILTNSDRRNPVNRKINSKIFVLMLFASWAHKFCDARNGIANCCYFGRKGINFQIKLACLPEKLSK